MYNDENLDGFNNGYTNDNGITEDKNINNTNQNSYEVNDHNSTNENAYTLYNGTQTNSTQYSGSDVQGSTTQYNSAQSNATWYGGVQYNSAQNNTQYNGTQYMNQQNSIVEDKNVYKKEKKQKGFFKRAISFVLAAVLFGVLAGSTMYGVYYVGNKYFPTNNNSNVEIPVVGSNLPTYNGNALSDISGDTNLTTQYSNLNVEAVATAALPAMVEIKGTKTVSSSSSYYYFYGGSSSYEATASGTGIIVGKNDSELLIVTNAHVVDDVNNLQCIFVDGSSVSATVKGAKSNQDIAVIAVALSDISKDTISKIAIAELETATELKVGQQVVVIGNALGEGQSVTAGVISALNRSITVNGTTFSGLIMTDAAINSGNSGGALLNAAGKVIGINFAKTSETGVEAMGYSIPVSNVSEIISSLMNKQKRELVGADKASYLGIGGVDITSSYSSMYGYPQGVLVRQVVEGSAAEQAGLSAYDIIVSFDDQTITSMSGLTDLLKYYAAGENVTIQYYHLEGNQYVLKSVVVTLGKKS